MKKLCDIECCLIDAVECQMCDLAAVDTHELGEVIDMIKDIEQAMYYCAKRKHIEEEEEYGGERTMHHDISVTKYHGDKGHHMGHMENGNGDWDNEENGNGNGHESKRHKEYMEAKEKHHDPSKKIEDLERYMQDLTSEMVDLVKDATPEERQLLHNRIVALGAKIEQLNH